MRRPRRHVGGEQGRRPVLDGDRDPGSGVSRRPATVRSCSVSAALGAACHQSGASHAWPRTSSPAAAAPGPSSTAGVRRAAARSSRPVAAASTGLPRPAQQGHGARRSPYGRRPSRSARRPASTARRRRAPSARVARAVLGHRPAERVDGVRAEQLGAEHPPSRRVVDGEQQQVGALVGERVGGAHSPGEGLLGVGRRIERQPAHAQARRIGQRAGDADPDDALRRGGRRVAAHPCPPHCELRQRPAYGPLSELSLWWAGVRGDAAALPPQRVAAIGVTSPLPDPPRLGVRRLPLDPPAEPEEALAWGVSTADALADEGADLLLLAVDDLPGRRVLGAELSARTPSAPSGGRPPTTAPPTPR